MAHESVHTQQSYFRNTGVPGFQQLSNFLFGDPEDEAENLGQAAADEAVEGFMAWLFGNLPSVLPSIRF